MTLEAVIAELERWPIHACTGIVCSICRPHVLADRLRGLLPATNDAVGPARSLSPASAPKSGVPQRRVIDPRAMARPSSIFEAMVEVEGRWMRLGELRRTECMSAAAAARRKSREYGAMADALESLGVATGMKPISRTLSSERIDMICRKACFDYQRVLMGVADVLAETERVMPRLEAV